MIKYLHINKHTYHRNVMYGQSLTVDTLPNRVYEEVEKRVVDVQSGTRVMVRKCRGNGILKHYITTKVDDGFVRQTIVFQEGESDPYPVTVDNVEYESDRCADGADLSARASDSQHLKKPCF